MNQALKARGLGYCRLLALAAALSGCSSGLEGVDKRLAAMQDEITKLQNQNDHLVERVDAMEVRQTKADAPTKAPSTATERPSLKVVKVLPPDDSGMPTPQVGTQAPGDAADDPSPRPLIKLRGGSGKGSEKGDGKGEG